MDPAVKEWRGRERRRLKEDRQRLRVDERWSLTDAVGRNLDTVLNGLPWCTLGLYWPIMGEFDLRPWAARVAERRSCRLALPVVVRERAPLEYWYWRPGDAMVRGFGGAMVPRDALPAMPEVVVAPLLGFSGLYRLGYGSGYFDRTLAAMRPKPTAIGVGCESGRLRDFIAQAHDVPMDVIVTERGIHRDGLIVAGGEAHC